MRQKRRDVARRRLYCESLERRELLATISGTVFRDHNQNFARSANEQSLQGWQVYLDENNNGQHDKTAHVDTFTSTNVPLDVPDEDRVQSSLEVSGLKAPVGDVNITLDITHPDVSGFYVYLYTPDFKGAYLLGLFEQSGANITNTTLDDEAATPIAAGTAPYTGTFQPSGPLSVLDGGDGNGTWTLLVWDSKAGNVGRINSWSLTISTAEPIRTSDANGAFSFDNLPAGRHIVRELPNENWVQTRPASGQYVFNAAADQVFTTATFGNDFIPSSISGVKFHDTNGDGVQNSGERGLAGWKIYLDTNLNKQWDTGERFTLTDANGAYRFDEVEPGDYMVREVQQPGWQSAVPVAPDVSAKSQASLPTVRSKPVLGGATYAPDKVIVKLRPGAAAAGAVAASSLRSNVGAAVAMQMNTLGMQVWKLNGEVSVESVIDRYWNDPRVEYIEPDYQITAAALPDDPRFNEQWALHNTGQTGGIADADSDVVEAWETTKGNRGVIVAVIDSGVDYTHPELADNIWTNWGELPGNGVDDDNNGYIDDIHGYDFMGNDGDPMDEFRHGTIVAGILGAMTNNGVGIAGVAQKVSIMPIRILNAIGSGDSSSGIYALDYAIRMGATISNNSWGGGPYSQALADALVAAGQQNHLFIAAAGNEFSNAIYFPAGYAAPNIISVAASTHNDLRAYYSNWHLSSVDLAAPGDEVLATTLNAGYRVASGTSMASPMVAGAAALLKAKNPDLNWQQIRDAILGGVDVSTEWQQYVATGGRLNAQKSLDLVTASTDQLVHVAPGDHVTGANLAGRLKDRMYFAATLPSGQREMFLTDGTTSGTKLFKDLSGEISSDPRDFTQLGEFVLFSAAHTNGQRELFISDGTVAGTKLLKDLNATISSDPRDFTLFDGKLYYSAINLNGERELFVTDGTFAGTQFVKDLSGLGIASDPAELTVFGDKLYFVATGATGQRELYRSDGTTAGTMLFANLSGIHSSSPTELTVFENQLYFAATGVNGQRELYRTDGTTTSLFKDLAGTTSSDPRALTVHNGRLYFSAMTTGGRELHSLDSNPLNAAAIVDLAGNISSSPQSLLSWNGQLFFTALMTNYQRELYRSDGTVAGTYLVRDFYPGASSSPTDFVAFDNRLFFTATRPDGQIEWHVSDGTPIGTMIFVNLSGEVSSSPGEALGLLGDSESETTATKKRRT